MNAGAGWPDHVRQEAVAIWRAIVHLMDMGPLSIREAYELYADELVRFASGLVGPADGSDAVSAAMLGVMGSSGWEGVWNERAYLYAAVLNEVRRHHRRTMRRRAAEARAAGVPRGNPIPEIRPDVLDAVGRLSVRQRAVVFLAYWEDLRPVEIARRLGLNSSTVYRSLERAERRLRRLLHE